MPKGLIHSPQYGLSCASVPYAVVAFRARPSLLIVCPSFRLCRWEDNIKIDLKEGKWEGVECIFLAQDRIPMAGAYEQPLGSIKWWVLLD
jgi:hypothetical protein